MTKQEPRRRKGRPGGYEEIAAHFRRQISEGALSPGDALPSMREVCEQFGAAITTVNRAFRVLKSEGLTVSKQGVGTVVAERPRVTSSGGGRLDRLKATGRVYAPGESSTDHHAMLRSCGDPWVASLLGVELHDEIVIRRRTFLQKGRPTVLGFSYIHMRAVGPVPEVLTDGPLRPFWQETYTERTGDEITRSPEMRGARLASRQELDWLSVDAPEGATAPVLVLYSVFYDSEGNPIEVWEDVFAPGLLQADSE